MTKKITAANISAFRMQRQHLCDEKPAPLATICRDVCGMQAQVMSAAEMAWWTRNHKLTRTEIQSALWDKRALVKTYAQRGTLHLLTEKDFPIYVSALQRNQVAGAHRIRMRAGLSIKQILALETAAMEALQEGALTPGELAEQVKPRIGKKTHAAIKQFWNIFRPLFAQGLVCYGPSRGTEVTFIRVEQWLPALKFPAEEEARQILLQRYLQAYGPATPQDFSRWAGIPMNEAKSVFAELTQKLVELETPQARAFLLREDEKSLRASKLSATILRLLPSFDVFMLGHVDKSLLVDKRNYKRVYRNQGWLSHVILSNGRVIGVWKYERRGKAWQLQIEAFEKFSKAIRAQVFAEAENLGAFLGIAWDFSKVGI